MKTNNRTGEIQQTHCYHCGNVCPDGALRIEQKAFCCSGCKMVYELLNENGLCTYYDLNSRPGSAQLHQVRADKFDFLEDNAIAQRLIRFSDARQSHVQFYLPQIHCSSCLWLLENIHQLNEGILASTVNFTRKEVFIQFDHEKTTLRKVVETLASIGYEPHISLSQLDEQPGKHSNKKQWIKIGIAGFCFANIMMLSFAEYFAFGQKMGGAVDGAMRYLSLLISLPVIFYAASDFFSSAIAGLRHRFLNIDAPIALALLITFLRSVYEIVVLGSAGYLDSMSGIVFFMLIGRALQDKTYQSISFDRDFRSFFPIAVKVKRGEQFVPTPVNEIRSRDVLRIHDQELIPVDAILSRGEAMVDYSFVSGESLPVHVQIGEMVYAGGKQIGPHIELMAVREVSQSYLTNLWNKDVFRKEKSQKTVIHRISKYFTMVVFLIGAIAALYWYRQGETRLMWNALTTILIVACPCALLLSATFTNGNILRILSANRFYVRHPDFIEELAKVNHIVFDKTGTLTESRNIHIDYSGDVLDNAGKQMLAAVLQQSTHPLSRIVFHSLAHSGEMSVDSFRTIPGKGIEAWVNDHHVKVGSFDFAGSGIDSGIKDTGTRVYFRIDDVARGMFRVSNNYREDIDLLLKKLQQNYRLSVISGDNDYEKPYLRSLLGNDMPILFRQSPADKLQYIEDLKNTGEYVMMIGDGLNDAGALKISSVGIALTDDSNNFTPASDAILNASGLVSLDAFLRFARRGRKIIQTSFVVSILYNLIGLFFAVQGILSPFIAAVLMPASSISIVLLTYGMSNWWARYYGLDT